MKNVEAVILIGHGAAASDTPRPLVEELKKLEIQRQRENRLEMSPREAELDREVRNWPRTKETDPYKFGLEDIGRTLAKRLEGRTLVLAYNEFCAPSVEDALEKLVGEGYKKITMVSTMFTRGGVHAELELPELVRVARRKHPGVAIDYAWPFSLDEIADFLAGHVKRHADAPSAGTGRQRGN